MTTLQCDPEALDEYARTRSPAAFARIVTAHADWVYSSALRTVRDRHLAEDVAQAVFLLLSQQPQKALGRPLNAWLFKVTRYCAANVLRAQTRREKHERQAALMNTQISHQESQHLWDQIAPSLDELVEQLRAKDRDLLLLRFYQRKSMAEIGQACRVSEQTARRQVSRVVEKLRAMLRSRGVTVPAVGLVGVLTAHTTHAAPPLLTAGLCAAAPATTSTAISLANAARRMMMLLKMKIAAGIVVGVAVVPAIVATSHRLAAATPAPTQSATLAAAETPQVGSPTDIQVSSLFNSHTDMVVAIDALALNWDAIDAMRNTLLLQQGTDAKTVDRAPIKPVFAHQQTALYRRWTSDLKSAGGSTIYLVSQIEPAPGAFYVFPFGDSADPQAMQDVCTPSSWNASHLLEPRLVRRMVVEANRATVTALAKAKSSPRPDLLEALAAINMPLRVAYSPAMCRRVALPTFTNVGIDAGAADKFAAAAWDNVVWVADCFRPPPDPAGEVVIKCKDGESALAVYDWVKDRPADYKLPRVKNISLTDDQVIIEADADQIARDMFVNTQFNIVP